MSDYLQVLTTTSSRDEALDIARRLVDEQLAACVQVGGPITSVYRWEGKIETGEEWTCVAKTRRELYPRVEAAITAAHSYDTPQILAVPIEAGSAKYLAWLASETAVRAGD